MGAIWITSSKQNEYLREHVYRPGLRTNTCGEFYLALR
jgi:hypothetical protein